MYPTKPAGHGTASLFTPAPSPICNPVTQARLHRVTRQPAPLLDVTL